MITLSRLDARRLRSLFRRRNLDLPPRGLAPPIVLVADPWTGLCIRHHGPHLAVESGVPGPRPESPETIVLPFDALADFKGLGPSGLTIETIAPGRTAVRWVDRGLPVRREYAVPEPASLPVFPASPGPLAPCGSDLLDALAEAATVAGEDSPRFALGSIQLHGAGSVIATDGRQLLIHHGLAFPWVDDLLVRPSRLFAHPELPRDWPVSIGRTEGHVVVRVGGVTVWLAIRADARYPRVDGIIPAPTPRTSRLRLDPHDAKILTGALGRLPGAEGRGGPVTLDLNGVVAVRASGEGDEHPTEVVLSRSTYTGDPVRVATDRSYLARALTLGLGAIDCPGPDAVVSGREGATTFAWQPLERDAALAPDPEAIRLASTTFDAPPTPIPDRREPSVSTTPSRSDPAIPTVTSAGPTPAVGLPALIAEAEALHQALADARSRAGRLVVALRRQQKQSRLVQATIRSLRDLRLQDVAG